MLTLADLDQRPELTSATLGLFAAALPGSHHLVCGIAARQGLVPEVGDLQRCLGVLLALDGIHVAAALGICAYSPQQVTLWGPAIGAAGQPLPMARLLVQEARRALRDGEFESLRTLVDVRNRGQRSLMQALGFSAWKDSHCYERGLADYVDRDLGGVRTAARADHAGVAEILSEAFPDSDHCSPNLVQREDEGYRHYLLAEDGRPVAAAAVQEGGRRSWMKLIAVARPRRGQHLSRRLLEGVLAAEARRGALAIGLEVLADNDRANRLYRTAGFARQWTATVMTAPV